MNGFAMENLDAALEGTKVVVIPAGVPRKVSNIFLLSKPRLNFFGSLE